MMPPASRGVIAERVCDEVGYSKDQLARIRTLQDFTADREPDVKCMWVRHFILRDDRRPKGRERIETLPQTSLTRSHLHVSRTYIVHDRVAEDVLLPSVSGNALTARPDDEGEFGLVNRAAALASAERQRNVVR
jgi:hypothetical protein